MSNPENNSVSSPRISLVAGETSGDLLASLLLKGLKSTLPANVLYNGIGGPKMLAQGFNSLWPMDTLSVNGLVEVIPHIPAILKLRKNLGNFLINNPPLAFIGVDAPDFNFALEKKLKMAGIPVVHFVSPSIWAWRGGRIHGIKRAVDHVLCLFPFEPKIYAKEGIPATFVGHPLADVIPMVPNTQGARKQLGLAHHTGKVIAVLPGSRRGEVSRLAPVFFAAMRLMWQQDKSLHFILPLASPALRELLAEQIQQYADLPLTITDGGSHQAMEAADVVLLASGTATLEAALYKKPMVISYKVPWLTGQIMKRQGYLPYVGLPNILAGRFVVPELLQDAATPDALAQACLGWLSQPAACTALANEFTVMHQTLKRDTANIAAQVVNDLLKSRGRL